MLLRNLRSRNVSRALSDSPGTASQVAGDGGRGSAALHSFAAKNGPSENTQEEHIDADNLSRADSGLPTVSSLGRAWSACTDSDIT